MRDKRHASDKMSFSKFMRAEHYIFLISSEGSSVHLFQVNIKLFIYLNYLFNYIIYSFKLFIHLNYLFI